MYKHFLAIKNVKPCLTPYYDYIIVAYYSRNNKQFPLFFTACNLYYIIQQNKDLKLILKF